MKYIIVGLGNPTRKYESTRHNAGFMAIDEIAKRHGIEVNKLKFKALIGEGIINNKKVVLVKPQTYMNNSGECLAEVINFYKESMPIVILDDIDIEFPSIRIRKKGSAGTHNGLKSIIKYIGHQDFPRIKISVGQCPSQMDLVDFVLGRFSLREKREIKKLIQKTADAVEKFLEDGIDAAMNLYNK